MVHPCDPLKRYASIDRHRDFHTICMVDDAGFEDTCRFQAYPDRLFELKKSQVNLLAISNLKS